MGPPVKFVPGGRFSTRVSVLAGVAATCLLAVAIYSRQTRPEPPTAPIYRSAAPTSSAAQLYSFTDATFTWPAGQPGDRYQLLVNGRDFRPIASIEVDAATSYSAGAQLAEALSSSGGFYWQIQTTAPDGRQSSSATMRVDMLQAPDPKLAPEQ